MDLATRAISALKLLQQEQQKSALQVTDGTAFSYGLAVGTNRGLQMAQDTLNDLLEEDDAREAAR